MMSEHPGGVWYPQQHTPALTRPHSIGTVCETRQKPILSARGWKQNFLKKEEISIGNVRKLIDRDNCTSFPLISNCSYFTCRAITVNFSMSE